MHVELELARVELRNDLAGANRITKIHEQLLDCSLNLIADRYFFVRIERSNSLHRSL